MEQGSIGMKRYQIDKINQLNHRVGHTMDLLNEIGNELIKLERDMEKEMIGITGKIINQKELKEQKKETFRRTELMKIIVSDEFNLLKGNNQSVEEYEKEKQTYIDHLKNISI